MFAQTLCYVKGNMHHNLAQELCQVLGKLRQLLGDFVPRPPTGALSMDPTGELPSPEPCMCHLHMLPIF